MMFILPAKSPGVLSGNGCNCMTCVPSEIVNPGTFLPSGGLTDVVKERMDIMNTKVLVVGVLTCLLPGLSAYAGESMSSSSATTLNQSASGNEASSAATTHTSTQATTSSSTTASTKSSTQATTQNPAN